MVQVHHDEGVANRIDPESCADAREGIGEALTGERIGQPLSRESTLIPGADVVLLTEGNTDGRDSASAQTARRGRRHWHVRTLFAREPGDLMVGQRHMRAAQSGVSGLSGPSLTRKRLRSRSRGIAGLGAYRWQVSHPYPRTVLIVATTPLPKLVNCS